MNALSKTAVRSPRFRVIALALAVIAWALFSVDWTNAIHQGSGGVFGLFASALASPDLSGTSLKSAFRAAWITVAYASVAMTVAIAFGLPLGLIASGKLLPASRTGIVVAIIVRAVLGFLRAIHELIWALLFVAAIGLSPGAGVLAIAIPFAGIIGRVFAERLQDVPDAPMTALESAGATTLQQFGFGRIPFVTPDMTSYLFYRFECAIRSAAVLSFIGLGGIGFQIHIALSDLRFERVATLLYSLIILIVIVDIISGQVRKRLVR